MIGTRILLRIPRLRQSSSSHTIINFTAHFQEYRCYSQLSCVGGQRVIENVPCLMGWNKKRKTVTPVWRPISTQSASNEECAEGNITGDPENVASIEQSENEGQIVSIVRAIADATITSSFMQAENTIGQADEIVASPSSLPQSDALKDSEDIVGGGSATSILQDSCAGDAETISLVSKEKHAISVEIGASVMRLIRGKDGSTQKSIEEDLGVKLIFPSSKKDDSIVVEGDSLDVIAKASEKIQAVVNETAEIRSLNYSHFISLPLAVYPELVEKLVKFQSTILGEGNPENVVGTMNGDSSKKNEREVKPGKALDVAVQLKVENDADNKNVALDIPLVSNAPKASKPRTSELGIDKSLFIKPKTFHLTVLMLKLWNKERVHAATEVLQSVSSKVMEALDNRPLCLRLKGLDLMKGSQSKAHILYAPIEEIGNEGRLSRACQVIIDAYVEAGLVLKKDIGQTLKLHATLMNSSHRKILMKGKRRIQPFDATTIFEKFESEEWGDYHIREAHLSQRFSYDKNGYYHCCASLPLP